MKITKEIEGLTNKILIEVFMTHKAELLANPLTYIAPAVWGSVDNYSLTPAQKDINKKVKSLVRQLFDLIAFNNLNQTQYFGVLYVLNDIIISKLIYMVALAKNQSKEKIIFEYQQTEFLSLAEPIGQA